MSTSGVKLLAETRVDTDGQGNPAFVTDFKRTVPFPLPGGGFHHGGQVVTPLDGLTESLFNLGVQQAVADAENAEGTGENFVAGDVIGGRL